MKIGLKIIVSFFLIIFIQVKLFCGEGMWLPHLLNALNEKEMKAMGMKMNAEDIYSVNKGSLKDAIVHFGGGCTSEIISGQGLLLTNHHCGYGYIQSHSSVEKNYLKNGYWAKTKSEELACGGLTATIISRIEDVTKQILNGTSSNMSEAERRPIIEKNIKVLTPTIQRATHEDVFIRAFFNGNQYFAFITVTYKDIRLVGTPPESIGKFGADTDNWVWPRHTGDFSLFRIYAGKNNLPADYSEENIPFTPKHFLPINMNGVQDGDFTMVFGFPGRTNEYLSREGVRQIVEVQNPIRVTMRDHALKIMDKYMRVDEQTKIQYSSIYAGIANAWKKWIGENQGVKFTKGLDRKQAVDEEYTKRVNANPAFAEYRNILSDLDKHYLASEKYTAAKEYYAEGFQRNLQLFNFYSIAKKLISTQESKGNEEFEKLKKDYLLDADGYYADYQEKIDQEILATLLEIFHKGCDPSLQFPELKLQLEKLNYDYSKYAKHIYDNSNYATASQLKKFLTMNVNEMKTALSNDPSWTFYEAMTPFIKNEILVKSNLHDEAILDLRRRHMESLIKVFPERKFYPDANSTLRVTYGQVEGFQPRDGACYNSKTYLDGVIEKYIPGDYEFDVHPKLIDLYKRKDYGKYAENGRMPVAFIASNHTTGGNSGSPAIDAHGNLIGLNFDRVWEGTMSDINYDRSICRNIMVDARFILFVIDKFAGASHLIDEMKLVYPKSTKSRKNKK